MASLSGLFEGQLLAERRRMISDDALAQVAVRLALQNGYALNELDLINAFWRFFDFLKEKQANREERLKIVLREQEWWKTQGHQMALQARELLRREKMGTWIVNAVYRGYLRYGLDRPFNQLTIDDLRHLKGIGPKALEKLKVLLEQPKPMEAENVDEI